MERGMNNQDLENVRFKTYFPNMLRSGGDSGSIEVPMATNDTLGTVKGKNQEGYVQVTTSGEMQVVLPSWILQYINELLNDVSTIKNENNNLTVNVFNEIKQLIELVEQVKDQCLGEVQQVRDCLNGNGISC